MLTADQIEALMQRCYVSNGKLSHYDYHAFAAAVWVAAIEEAAREMDAMQEHDSTNYYRHAAMCIRALAEQER